MSMEPYSPEALEKQRRLDEKTARGEIPTWSDLHGILQPNPDLLTCPAWEDLDYQCERARGHEGPHRHVIEWGAPMTHDRHFEPDEHPDHDATDPDCRCPDCMALQADLEAAELAADGWRDDRWV